MCDTRSHMLLNPVAHITRIHFTPLFNFPSGALQDLLVITFHRGVVLKSTAGWRELVFVYDWDLVSLADNVTVFASTPVNLCTDRWPCALQLSGNVHGKVEQSGDAQLACLSSFGCSSILIRAVEFICKNNSKPAFKIEGTELNLQNASFDGCRADTDGGVVQAYDLSRVLIDNCKFTNVLSSNFGGAVAAYGSSLSISNSLFHKCSSRSGGGAVWLSVFQNCYGSDQIGKTFLNISSTVFSQCSTGSTVVAFMKFD